MPWTPSTTPPFRPSRDPRYPRAADVGGRRPDVPRAAAASALLAFAALAGCAAVRPATMALPPALAALPAEALDGLGAGRRGEFLLAGEPVRYERGLDRLQLFDLLARERSASRYRFEPAGGQAVEALCQGRQTTLSIGGAEATARPARLACQWQGSAAPARLTLDAIARAGGREERQGVFSAGPLTLELQSVHRWDGAALPAAEPVGYLLSLQGRPVGAVELNGRPRLWRPAEPGPLRDAVTLAALALALSWGPGG